MTPVTAATVHTEHQIQGWTFKLTLLAGRANVRQGTNYLLCSVPGFLCSISCPPTLFVWGCFSTFRFSSNQRSSFCFLGAHKNKKNYLLSQIIDHFFISRFSLADCNLLCLQYFVFVTLFVSLFLLLFFCLHLCPVGGLPSCQTLQGIRGERTSIWEVMKRFCVVFLCVCVCVCRLLYLSSSW